MTDYPVSTRQIAERLAEMRCPILECVGHLVSRGFGTWQMQCDTADTHVFFKEDLMDLRVRIVPRHNIL
jgi:hypothetical protein